MNPQTEARLERVKRTSRSARRVCFWLMALVSLGALIMAATTVALPESLTCDINGLRRPCSDLPPQAVAFAYAALLGGLAIVLTTLYRLARLFENYSRGEIFTRDSVREIRWLGYMAVAYALFQLVLFIGSLAFVATGGIELPPDLRLEFPIGPAVMAAFILLLSWIMDVGAEMREENELTV